MKPILALQHVPHETLGTVQPALNAAGLPCRRVDLYRGAAQRLPLDRVAGLVVLGGPMNVDETDSRPFLEHEIGWYPIELAGLDYIDPQRIRERIPQELPQMQAVGARVFERFATICRERA